MVFNGLIIGDCDGVRWIVRCVKSFIIIVRIKDGDFFESESKGVYEFGVVGCLDVIVVLVRFVLDGDRQGEFVEVVDIGDINVEVGLEVVRVIRMVDEFFYF